MAYERLEHSMWFLLAGPIAFLNCPKYSYSYTTTITICNTCIFVLLKAVTIVKKVIISGSHVQKRILYSIFELSLSVDTPQRCQSDSCSVGNSLYFIALTNQLLKRPQPIYKLNKYWQKGDALSIRQKCFLPHQLISLWIIFSIKLY